MFTFKEQARLIQTTLRDLGGHDITLGHAYEVIAKINGKKSWNVLSSEKPKEILISKNKWDSFEKTTPKLASFLTNTKDDDHSVLLRLQKEKEDLSASLEDQGKSDGLRLAQSMSYKNLKYITEKYSTTDEYLSELRQRGLNHGEHNPCDDSVLGGYFRDAIKELPIDFKISYLGEYRQSIPDEHFRELENSLVNTIRDFWEINKHKI